MKGFSLAFSKRNVAFLGICIGGLVLLVVVSILPLIAQIKLIEHEIPQIKTKMAEQADLAMIIRAIDKKLKELEEMPSLPAVSTSTIPLVETSSVSEEIKSLAKQENIKILTIEPIIPKSGIKLTSVRFISSMQGDLPDLRSFLFALLQVPYIDNIERLKIQSNENILGINLTFTVRLS